MVYHDNDCSAEGTLDTAYPISCIWPPGFIIWKMICKLLRFQNSGRKLHLKMKKMFLGFYLEDRRETPLGQILKFQFETAYSNIEVNYPEASAVLKRKPIGLSKSNI